MVDGNGVTRVSDARKSPTRVQAWQLAQPNSATVNAPNRGSMGIIRNGVTRVRVSDARILGSYACWILEHRKHQKPMDSSVLQLWGVGRLSVWSDVTSEPCPVHA